MKKMNASCHMTLQPEGSFHGVGQSSPWMGRVFATGLLMGALACGSGSSTSGPTAQAVAAPSIASFTTSSYVLNGQSSALSWNVNGATRLSIDQGIGAVTGTSVPVAPTRTTTYTLTASNDGGSTSATCSLTVYPATAGVNAVIAGTPYLPLVDGPVALAKFYMPTGVVKAPSGDLYVTDTMNMAIRVVSPQGQVTTLQAGLPGWTSHVTGPSALALGSSGTLYFLSGSSLCALTPGGAPTTLAGSVQVTGSLDGAGSSALFNMPLGVAVDASGTLYVSDSGNNTIRKVTPQGAVTTFAGTAGLQGHADGAGAQALFNAPGALAFDPSGNLRVVDTGNACIRSIAPAGVVTTLAPYSLASASPALTVGPDGTLYLGGTSSLLAIAPDGTATTLAGREVQTGLVNGQGGAARFWGITGLTLDALGNLYAVDCGNNVIRQITPQGRVTTVAGAAYPNLTVSVGASRPGYLYVPDMNNTIQKVSAGGIVTSFAGIANQSGNADGPAAQALFGSVAGTAVDAAGNVYATDYLNATIRKITPDGIVSTLAGTAGEPGTLDGRGSAARFTSPFGIAADGQGNLYVSDAQSTIRKITPDGTVTTLAGTAGQLGFADGTGAAARFDHPYGLAVDALGNVFVADSFNGAVRKITPAGTVTTLAASLGYLGSAGKGWTMADYYAPYSIALDGSGKVYAGCSGGMILQITPDGLATPFPQLGVEAMDWGGTAVTLFDQTFFSISPYGVESISGF